MTRKPATIPTTKVIGTGIKYGDTLQVWWGMGRDQVIALENYEGQLPITARTAQFASGQSMTIESDAVFTRFA